MPITEWAEAQVNAIRYCEGPSFQALCLYLADYAWQAVIVVDRDEEAALGNPSKLEFAVRENGLPLDAVRSLLASGFVSLASSLQLALAIGVTATRMMQESGNEAQPNG